MGIVHIKEKLESDMESVAKDIKSDSVKKIEEEKKKWETEKKTLRENFEKETSSILESDRKREFSFLSRETRLQGEKAKREILEEVFKEALSRLNSVSEDLIAKFVEKSVKNIPESTEAKVIVSIGKKGLFERLLKRYYKFSIEEDGVLRGGFLLVGREFMYDFTFENLLNARKTELELELAKVLFSESDF